MKRLDDTLLCLVIYRSEDGRILAERPVAFTVFFGNFTEESLVGLRGCLGDCFPDYSV